jgi:hypothetical protein
MRLQDPEEMWSQSTLPPERLYGFGVWMKVRELVELPVPIQVGVLPIGQMGWETNVFM